HPSFSHKHSPHLPLHPFPTRRSSDLSAHPRPLTVLTPMRSPVNEPGPMETARPSRSRGVQRASARTRSTAASRRSEWVTLMSRRSEEHTSELQSRVDLVCRLLLEKKK